MRGVNRGELDLLVNIKAVHGINQSDSAGEPCPFASEKTLKAMRINNEVECTISTSSTSCRRCLQKHLATETDQALS